MLLFKHMTTQKEGLFKSELGEEVSIVNKAN